MRSLIVLDRLPYPPMGGQQLRYRQTIEALARLGPVTLLLLAGRAAGPEAATDCPPVIRIDPEVPHGRLYRWSGVLGRAGKKRLRAALRRRHQTTVRARLAALVAGLAPDVVVVENPELMACLPELRAPGRRLIYDAHNVERLLWADLVALRGRLGAAPGRSAFRERILAGEAALAAGADQVWACSEADARLFATAYPGSRAEVRVIPNTVDVAGLGHVAEQRRRCPRPDRPPTVLFTGNFGYLPNLEAARLLLEEIRPRLLARLPRLEVVLSGRQPPAELRAAAGPGITVTGEVPDMAPWFAACDAVVVPLRHGGGTRLKILEALAAGCPVVSTAKGAEGLALRDPDHLRLAETPDGLADALAWCLDQPEAAAAMAERGRAQVGALYSWDAHAARVAAALAPPRPVPVSA